MKKYLLYGFLAILLISIVSAADFNITTMPIRDNIDIEQTAQFLILITSNSTKTQNIRIYSPEVEWTIPTQTVKVYSNSDADTKVTITPTKYIDAGLHGIKINFKEDDTNDLIERIVFVNVRSPGEAVSSYSPSVTMKVTMPSVIDPREPVLITIMIENQNTLNLTDLKLKIDSTLDNFNTEQDLTLGSLGKKAIELSYELDPLQEPGEYKLSFDLLKGKESIETAEPKTVTISSVNPVYIEKLDVSSGFLRTVVTATYTSNSNVKDVQTVKYPTSMLKRLFTSTSLPSKTQNIDEQLYKTVELELGPGETKTVEFTESYWPALIVLIAVLIGLLIYMKYKSPVKIRKGITDIKIKEGGVSELKIMLEIKNVSKKNLKNIIIVDYVPNITDLSKEFIEGTLKPTRMLKHPTKGTVLKWELEEITAGEDRLISYDLKAKLSIIGNFRVPRAKVILKRKGKNKHVYSNSLGVSA